MLQKLGHGSQARVKLAIKVADNNLEEIDFTNYVPEYFAIKVYIKPYLKKQRSFIR